MEGSFPGRNQGRMRNVLGWDLRLRLLSQPTGKLYSLTQFPFTNSASKLTVYGPGGPVHLQRGWGLLPSALFTAVSPGCSSGCSEGSSTVASLWEVIGQSLSSCCLPLLLTAQPCSSPSLQRAGTSLSSRGTLDRLCPPSCKAGLPFRNSFS